MIIGINCGHTAAGAGYGASGIINESEHTRIIGRAVMAKLRELGVMVVDCTVDAASSQNAYLDAAVCLANKQPLDLFLSIHFNASGDHKGQGVEVFTYTGRQLPEAVKICNNIASLSFKNRGVKDGSNLYVIKHTKAPAILIEVCFCDNQYDVNWYMTVGTNAIADAICNALSPGATADPQAPEITTEEFIKFVGEIAKQDWIDRRIMLPSVVVAQAIIESNKGKSELATKANALFGIKANGWGGRTYKKTATEQRPDGSYYTVDDTLWRAYDDWEKSILDHNNYIATRSTDGGKTLRYAPVIGCNNYILACQYLQQCGYATSISYDKTLIDCIEKYDLTKFDAIEDEEAPDGKLWVVQLGAYKSKNRALSFINKLEKAGVISILKLYDVN